MTSRRAHITKYTSQALEVRFRKRASSKFCPDDSTLLIPRLSENLQTLIDGLYVIGAFPWEYTQPPRVMYSFPENDPSPNIYCPFVLPNGCNFQYQTFHHTGELFSEVYSETSVNNGELYTLYFPENRSAPYLFFYRFTVNPLTIPSFAHDLSLKELLSHVTHSVAPTCELCLAIKTRLPFVSLFKGFVKWILNGEMIARMKAFDTIDKYLESYKFDAMDDLEAWPAGHRRAFESEIINVLSSSVPEPEKTIVVDRRPFPVFEWTRPYYPKSYYELAKVVMFDLFKKVNSKMFMTIFSALLLEKTIVFYHKCETVICNAVLALHYLLKPLRWVSGSISSLPYELADLLNAPNPFLIGTVNPLAEIVPDYVYVDLEDAFIQVGDPEAPVYPRAAEMERTVRELWKHIESPESPELLEILSVTNTAVGKLIDPVLTSIITDFSNKKCIQSKFFVELYLKHFVREERSFMEAFCETQMFHLHIEQECRRRSDHVHSQYRDAE